MYKQRQDSLIDTRLTQNNACIYSYETQLHVLLATDFKEFMQSYKVNIMSQLSMLPQ